MKISEYIKHLEAIAEREGDIEVTNCSYNCAVVSSGTPTVRNLKILAKRESKVVYFESWFDKECKGEKVVALY